MGAFILSQKFLASILAIGTGAITTLIGGWDIAMEIMMIFVISDYISGVIAAYKTKELSSSVGFEGIFKKGSMFLIVIVAAQLDRITNNNTSLFRTSTCFFFIANDGLSIVENVRKSGVKLPHFIETSLKKMRNDNGKSSLYDDNSKDDNDD